MAKIINGVMIGDNERVDDLNRNGCRIIQNPEMFCFGMDAVLLSSFCNVKKGERVLDLGTGNGVIPILLETKTKGREFIGIDIQKESVDLAQRSIALNAQNEKVKAICCDINNISDFFKNGEFDVVTSNPPYMSEGTGLVNDFNPKAIARHELYVNISQLTEAASKMLRFAGRFYMVHRPHRLTDIMTALRGNNLEPKRIRFVHPFKGEDANMVLIESSKGGRPSLKVYPPLYIYREKGIYSQEVMDIYYR